MQKPVTRKDTLGVRRDISALAPPMIPDNPEAM
jgi:hypothetical protein